MGQKVNPIGYRLGVNKDWQSKWYADKNYADLLNNDIKIRKYLSKNLKEASIASVLIERKKNRCDITINTAKPGVIIGRGGEDIEKLRNALKKITNEEIYVTIVEEKNPDMNAKLVADSIAKQIEARANFRNVQKKAIQRVMKAGAMGIKTSISGRLAGADIARAEGYKEGVVSLHTLRMDVDYALAEASTTYGKLGIKVYISKGEVLPSKKVVKEAK